MEVKAVARDTGLSHRKAQLMVDMVRGKAVEDALNMLKFSTSPSALIIAKAIKSAAANAERVYQLSASDLKVARIYADKARTLKRFRPRARGRANHILKRSSHITVVVSEQES